MDGKVGTRTWAALVDGGGLAPRGHSDAGAPFITRHEGFCSKPYDDPAGHCTIGNGHLIHRGRCTGSEFDALVSFTFNPGAGTCPRHRRLPCATDHLEVRLSGVPG